MVGEIEAAGDVLTGGVVAGAVERGAQGAGASGPVVAAQADHGACSNCAAAVTGAYCSACGQAVHIHRSLLSLGHDILHGVFHLEGRTWRTIPELFFHPGRLTRRYIDGERVKFVSPMALFLFVVFLMFAVFSFTGGALVGGALTGDADLNLGDEGSITERWQAPAIEATDRKLATLREQLARPDLPATQRADLDRQVKELEEARQVMDALGKTDFVKLDELAKTGAAAGRESTLQHRLSEGLRHAKENPSLLFYKLKVNGYKFSWALIPLSVPFLWLLFFWRRDIRLYDHAIFVTYSISFMMLLVVLLSIGAALGMKSGLWGTLLAVVPPLHLYKQLRGAYGLSRFGAAMRMFMLLIMTLVILILFVVLLLLIGVLG